MTVPRRWLLLTGAVVAFASCSAQTPVPEPHPLGVAFQPRGFREVPVVEYPTAAEVRTDLALLASVGFRSLVTFGAERVLGETPALARAAGFNGMVVMGIWNPLSDEELSNALAQAPFVDAYCVGNEGLGVRYGPEQLAGRMAYLRQATGKPVTTSEPLIYYLEGPYRDWLHEHSDWLFPNVHPYLAGRFDANSAIDWTVARYDYLAATAGGKPVIFKEVGYPTHRDDCCGEEVQRSFFEGLLHAGIRMFLFEAFDQPGKAGRVEAEPEVEQHWGLFRADGTPKASARWLIQNGRAHAP